MKRTTANPDDINLPPQNLYSSPKPFQRRYHQEQEIETREQLTNHSSFSLASTRDQGFT